MAGSQGLEFRKLDLHVHTPASACYKHNHAPEQIVRAALQQGLDAIAITDHNTAAWVDRIKAAAEKIKIDDHQLTVFPGVEISVHEGYHVVAIFSPNDGQTEVENFLGAIGIRPSEYGKSEALCEKSVIEVLTTIHKRQGLAVLAHIDAPKGAFYESAMSNAKDGRLRVPQPCIRLFNGASYDAVEVVHKVLPEGLDAAHHITRTPAFYQASDNPDPQDPRHHSKDGIGARHSYFKLDEITLEGLRQCFTDPEVRIALSSPTDGGNWPHILQMRVGDKGFLAYQRFDFHRGLNCLIGGKGVGKSLVIEFLRFAFAQASRDDAIRKDHDAKLDKQLQPFNTVAVEFELTNGVRYTLERTYEGNGKGVFSCVNQSSGEQYSGDIAQLFPLLAYSQTEVVKIAESEDAQLTLLDSLFDARPYRKAIAETQAQLRENDIALADALDARTRLDEAQSELATLTEQIANVDQLLDSPLMQKMRYAQAKHDAFDSQVAYLDQLADLSEGFLKSLVSQIPPALSDNLVDDAVLQQISEATDRVHHTFIDEQKQAVQLIKDARKTILEAKRNWLPSYEALYEDYMRALRGGDYAALEARRRTLSDEKKGAESRHQRYRVLVEDRLPELLKCRSQLLERLDVQQLSYFAARKRKFDQLSNASEDKLRLTLMHAGNRAQYIERLNGLLAGSYIGSISIANRRRIAEAITPSRLGEMIIAHDIAALQKASGLTRLMAERVMDKLWAADNFVDVLALQHDCYPQDAPSIKYNKGRGQFASLDELSVGQKSTALLIIALCDGKMPVIIDQPEDALDITSVWEDIAKKLRHGKYGRQFILTTHNSSLAVGSDSDSFMVLTPLSGDRAKVSYRGAIDRQDVRQAVIDHLEGGDEPYKLRQRKYNIN